MGIGLVGWKREMMTVSHLDSLKPGKKMARDWAEQLWATELARYLGCSMKGQMKAIGKARLSSAIKMAIE